MLRWPFFLIGPSWACLLILNPCWSLLSILESGGGNRFDRAEIVLGQEQRVKLTIQLNDEGSGKNERLNDIEADIRPWNVSGQGRRAGAGLPILGRSLN